MMTLDKENNDVPKETSRIFQIAALNLTYYLIHQNRKRGKSFKKEEEKKKRQWEIKTS